METVKWTKAYYFAKENNMAFSDVVADYKIENVTGFMNYCERSLKCPDLTCPSCQSKKPAPVAVWVSMRSLCRDCGHQWNS